MNYDSIGGRGGFAPLGMDGQGIEQAHDAQDEGLGSARRVRPGRCPTLPRPVSQRIPESYLTGPLPGVARSVGGLEVGQDGQAAFRERDDVVESEVVLTLDPLSAEGAPPAVEFEHLLSQG